MTTKANEEIKKNILCQLHDMSECNFDGVKHYNFGRQDVSEMVVKVFSTAVNSFGFDRKAFLEAFKNEHRTLQQSMFREILKLIEYVASNDFPTDPRNEASKKIAVELNAVIQGRNLPLI